MQLRTIRMQIFALVLLFTSAVFPKVTALEVNVIEVTTSSVSLEWSTTSNSSTLLVSYGYDGNMEELNSRERKINLSSLMNAETYNFHLEESDTGEQKVFTLTTAKCPNGWKGWENSCFWASENKMKSWEEALEACNSIPTAHLANPRSEEENLFLTNVIPKKNMMYWIGLDDRDSKGNFTYTDGSSVRWRNVTSDSSLSNCILVDAIQFQGQSPGWMAFDCDGKRDYICQYHVQPAPKITHVTPYSTGGTARWDRAPSIYGSSFTEYRFNLSVFEDKYDPGDGFLARSYSVSKWFYSLKPGYLHFLTIHTVHDVGEYDVAMSAIYPATPFVTKTLDPTDFRISVIRPTYVTLSWNHSRRESIYDSYRLNYMAVLTASESSPNKTLNPGFNHEGEVVVDKNVTEITLTNLEPNVQYAFGLVSVSNFVTINGNYSGSSSGVNLFSITPLAPPRNLHVVESSLEERSFRVSWTEAIGTVDGYLITVFSATGNEITHNLSTNNTHFDVTGLLPGHTYEVGVDSIYHRETSEVIHINQTTRPVKMERNAIYVQAPGNTSVEVVLLRNVPSEFATYDGFNLTFSATEHSEEIHWRIPVENSDVSSATNKVVGLTPGRKYTLTVYTTSGDVASFPVRSRTTIKTKPATPSPLRYTIRTERTIRLQWDEVPGDIDGFLITCSGVERSCSPEFTKVKRDDLELEFKDLTPGAEYNFTLSVERLLSKSRTISLVVRTKPNQPDKHLALSCIQRNTTSFTLSWLKPRDLCDAFRLVFNPRTEGVNVTNYATAGDVIIPSEEPENAVITKTLRDLTSGLTYDISVTSLSGDVGSSPLDFVCATLPNVVEKLEAEQTDETWVQLSWQPGLGGFVTFQVSWTDVTETIPVLLSSRNVTDTSLRITSLQPATMHFITVSAYSVDDVSLPEAIFVQTRPLPPVDLRLEVENETSFVGEWEGPQSRHDEFVLKLFQLFDNTEKMLHDVTLASSSDNRKEFNDLTPGGRYRFVIETSLNKTRSYPVRREFSIYPMTPENVTVASVTSSAINITWDRPEGLIGGYKVDHFPAHGQMSMSGVEAAFTGLTPGVKYDFNVVSLSEDKSLSSRLFANAQTTTDESEPSAPEELVLVSNEASSISASWNPPRHPNGRLLNYTIEFWQLFPHPNEEFKAINIDAKHTNHVIRDVEDGAVYYVKVSAVNSAGRGPLTEPGRVKVLESLPGRVSNLEAMALNSSYVVVSWNYPESPNGEITKYQLTVENPEGEEVADVVFNPQKNVNPFKCIFDIASREAITRLLFRHASAIDVVASPSNEDNDVILTSPPSGSGQVQSDITKELQQLTEVQQWVNTSTVSVDVMVTSQGSGSGVLPQETTDVSEEEGESADDQENRGTDLSDVFRRKRRSLVGSAQGTFEQLCPVHYTVDGLEPYTVYNVTVRVWTAVGEGEMARTQVRTKQEPPEGPPTNIHPSMIGSRSVTFSWSPPYKPNGIPSYTLTLYRVDSQTSFDTDEESLQIDDLKPYSKYAVTVRASTAEGNGPESPLEYFITAQGEPESVGNISMEADGPRSMLFTWTPPMVPHGLIQRYIFELTDHSDGSINSTDINDFVDPDAAASILDEVEQRSKSDQLGPLITHPPQTPVSHKITDKLKPFNTYTASITAETSGGKGHPRSVTFRTHESFPGSPPVNLAYSNLTSTSVNITWGVPRVPNGVIIGYTVYISHKTMRTKYVRKQYAIVGNLKKYTRYETFVSAHTEVGEGMSTFKIPIHTDEDVPDDAPSNVTYRNISSTVIHLTWFPPAITNGIVRAYTVYYTNTSGTYSATSNETSLYLEHLQTYGKYDVSISSNTSKGESQVRSHLLHVRTMEGQPATPPYDLAYVNQTSRSVRMTWLAPMVPNGIIQYYNVTVSPLDGSSGQRNFSFSTENAKPEAMVELLRPHSAYMVSVRANTKYGDGEKESDPMTIYTKEDVPGNPPSLSETEITSTTVDFSFGPPITPNGIVRSYTLRYYPLGNQSSEEIIFLNGDDTSTRVNDLMMYTSYNFSLTASTSVGEGPMKSIVLRTDEDEPSSPPYDITYRQVNSTVTDIILEWKAPVKPNGVIVNYDVIYREIDSDSIPITIKSPVPQITLNNLQKFTQYEVQVVPYTRVGSGNQISVPQRFETLEDDPEDPPRDVRVEPTSSTSLRVAWQPPLTPNGRIQYYTVYYVEVDGEEKTAEVRNSEETIITNLKKWTEYDVRVTASTALGDGEQYSDIVRARTSEDVPGAVSDLLCNATDAWHVSVKWSNPVDPNGVITGYSLTVSDPNSESSKRVLLLPSQWLHVFQDLTPHIEYKIVVSATTSVGEGVGTECYVWTHESVPNSPLDGNVVKEQQTNVTITWREPDQPNGVILGYRLQCERRGQMTPQRCDFEAEIVDAVVRVVVYGLQKNSEYFIRALAFTAVGDGPWSDQVVASTLPGVPDHAVVNLAAKADSSTSVSVNWNAHLPLTGSTFFRVVIRRMADQLQVGFEDNLSDEDAFFSGLMPYTTYEVEVTPFVSEVKGFGPKAVVTITTHQDKPATPVQYLHYQNLTSTSVVLLWNSPSRPNGLITKYMVRVEGLPESFTNGNETMLAVGDLGKYQNYSATVISFTHVGAGPEASVRFQTAQDVPSDAPSNVMVQPSALSAVITWDPPAVPNGIVTNYSLSYRKIQNVHTPFSHVTVVSTQRELRDLEPFTLYEMSVEALTVAGPGPKAWSTFTTSEHVPSMPTKLQCTMINESSIDLKWNSPAKPNGIVTDYIISYQVPDKQQSFEPISVNSVELGETLINLTAYTEYDIEVFASTSAGTGDPAVCRRRTGEGYPHPPEGVMVPNFTDTTIFVSWREPIRSYGILSNYILTFWPPDGCKENKGEQQVGEASLECFVKTGLEKSYRLRSLQKFTQYSFTLAAQNGKGVGEATSPAMTQRTNVGVPDDPARNVQAVALSSTSVNVTWSRPSTLAGITRYKVAVVNSATGKITESPILAPDVRDHVIGGLEEYSTYNVTVTVATTKGELSSSAVQVETHEGVPSDSPVDVKVVVVMGNSSAAKVLFRSPRDPNGQLTLYTIQYRIVNTQDVVSLDVPTSNLSEPLTPKESYSWPVVGLLGGRSYTFRVRAATAVGPGIWSDWTAPVVLPITAAPVPDRIPVFAIGVSESGGQTNSRTSTSFTVKSPCVFSDENGPLASISVIVAEDGSDLEKEPTDWYEAMTLDPVPPYKVIFSTNPTADCPSSVGIAALANQAPTRRRRSVEDGQDEGFVVGGDNTCDESKKSFCNGPLKTNTEYRVKYRAETTTGAITDTVYSEAIRTDPSFLEANFTLIVGVAAAVGAFLLILIILVVIIRRRLRNKSKGGDSEFVAMPGNSPRKGVPVEESLEKFKGPITESSAHSNMAFVLEPSRDDKVSEVAVCRPVGKVDFAGHITRLSMNKNKGFSGEFDDIRGLPVAGTTMAADKQFNRSKNRHAKLVPFDHSRVKLEAIPAIEGSDYINASYVPGPQSADQFIVTQTPLEHTRKDFWRLVWETGTGTIVMLCSSSEEGKKKSVDYWPTRQTEYYGNLAVQMTHEDTQLDWVIRQFSITMRDKVRHLTQFQLMTWPVHEQSDNAQTVLRFVQTVRANRKPKSTPIVVMCTSGSGRSGVFVCLDRMLENLSSKSQVDVFGNVAALRRYRPYMVQTLSEYILIHRCVWEAANQKVIGEEQVRRPPTGDGLEETVF